MSTPHPGKWKPVFETTSANVPPRVVLDTEQIAAHASVIYNESSKKWKVLYYYGFPREGPNDKVQTRIWDPDNPGEPPTHQDIPDWPIGSEPIDPPRLFCGGHTYLANGELIMAGGIRYPDTNVPNQAPHYPDEVIIRGHNYTYIFNPNPPVPGQEWRIAEGPAGPHALADDRYYPTLTHLGEIPQNSTIGNIVVMSGWIQDPNQALEPQYYDEIDGWKPFPNSGSTQPFNGRFDFYPGSHLIPAGPNAGKIFYCIPMKQSYVFDPFWDGANGPGYWQAVGPERANYRLNGTSTMLPLLPPYNSARVIIMGGSASYEFDPAINSAEVIDIASASELQWTLLDNFLFFKRKNHINVILPNDMLLVVGGNVNNFGDDPVYSAELVDTTQTNLVSTMLPAHVYPREHHSNALLLPDATVWLAGGGEVGEDFDTEKNAEIYEPGYLFEGERPNILSAPDATTYDRTFNISTSHEIAAIRLIRLGAITHSTDMSQRSVGLDFFLTATEYIYTVTPPPSRNIAHPGLYMLFVLRDKIHSLSGETMIPSIAKIIKLT